MTIDLESLGLTEIIRLRERLSDALVKRFERTLAIAVVEGVDLTGATALPGGGALASFATVDAAAAALVELLRRAAGGARAAVHWGPVLTNGRTYAGEAVDICAQVAAGAAGELRLTRQAYVELSSRYRLRCAPLPPQPLERGGAVEIVALHWREWLHAPAAVCIEETGEHIVLPDRPLMSFGRLPGNDVVLRLPDRASLVRIRRMRHFELVRELDDLYLRPLAEQPTLVDEQVVPPGDRARVVPGTVVKLAGVMTLRFLADDAGEQGDDAVLQTVAAVRAPRDDR
jgi:hypothetical protein